VLDEQGRSAILSGGSGQQWSVKLKSGQAAETVYRLVLYEAEDSTSARSQAEVFNKQGLGTEIIQEGQALYLGSKLLNDNRKYLVTIGPYATEAEADERAGTMPWGGSLRVIPEISAPPMGILDLVDPFGRVVLSTGDAFMLQPEDPVGGRFTIYGVSVGKGYWWERQEDRAFRGKMEFRVGNDGHVLAINELPLETYLKGVLPGEMSPGFPPAALRAQALAARNYAIAKMGVQHRQDHFDLCASVHCQVYSGTSKEHPATNQAVDETRGQVLLYQDRVCETFYSAVCGGHTEDAANVWGGPPQGYLGGVVDISPRQKGLVPQDLARNEESLRVWIESTPPVYCNHLADDAPRYLHYTRKHFRWEFSYSRQELEQIIEQKTGQGLGNLLDVKPMSRGPSGRMIEVQILGDAGQLTVRRELKIRGALSPTYLPSACFVVDKEMNENGLPTSFIFRGAGWGHGVGMCQTGAAGMALQGLDHHQILSHYYPGSQISQIYGGLL
jgi:SpoIID/LytB domain protein